MLTTAHVKSAIRSDGNLKNYPNDQKLNYVIRQLKKSKQWGHITQSQYDDLVNWAWNKY